MKWFHKKINIITSGKEDFLMTIQKHFKTLLSSKLNTFINKHIYGIKANENVKKHVLEMYDSSTKSNGLKISPKIETMIKYDLQQCNSKIQQAVGNIQVICYEILRAKNNNCTENRDAVILMFDKALHECYKKVIKEDMILNVIAENLCDSHNNCRQIKKFLKKKNREEITGGPDEVYDIIMNTEPSSSASAKKKKNKKLDKEVHDQIVEDFRAVLKSDTVEKSALKKIIPSFSQEWLFHLSNVPNY